MSDLPIGKIGSIQGPAESLPGAKETGEKNGSFEAVINDAMSRVSQVQEDVEKAVSELAAGGDITDAVLAIEKADMSFQLMLEIRNKLITTYEEVMKMQV